MRKNSVSTSVIDKWVQSYRVDSIQREEGTAMESPTSYTVPEQESTYDTSTPEESQSKDSCDGMSLSESVSFTVDQSKKHHHWLLDSQI